MKNNKETLNNMALICAAALVIMMFVSLTAWFVIWIIDHNASESAQEAVQTTINKDVEDSEGEIDNLLEPTVSVVGERTFAKVDLSASTEVDEESEKTDVLETGEPETTKGFEPIKIDGMYVVYDVPLEEEVQHYIFALCEDKDLDPAIVLGMIWRESGFDASTIGDKGKAFGLMQIQPRWHEARIEKLGITDLLDPYQNVTIGIDIFAELMDHGESLEWALTAYNGGYGRADKYERNGEISAYAEAVIENSEKLMAKVGK